MIAARQDWIDSCVLCRAAHGDLAPRLLAKLQHILSNRELTKKHMKAYQLAKTAPLGRVRLPPGQF